MKKYSKTELELQLLDRLEIAINAERKKSSERIKLLEAALANSHKVFAKEIEQLHKQLRKKHSR